MQRFGRRTIRRALAPAAIGLLAFAAVASASVSYPSLTRSSTFDSTNEGWVTFDGTNFGDAMWQASGGNPAGYISGDFPGAVGEVESSPGTAGSTWQAGNALGDYGGTLGVDVSVHLDGTSNTEDLVIGFGSDNASAFVCDDVGTPTASWTTYTLTLDTAHLVQCLSGNPLTGAQASAELAGFNGMFVLAQNGDGVEEAIDVDNAHLSAPQVAQAPPTGKIQRALAVAAKGDKIVGEIIAPDDYSCAGKAKVTIFEKGKKLVKVGTATASAANPKKQFGPATFTFKLKKGSKGKYLATAAKSASKLDGNSCGAASDGVTIR